MTAAGCLRYGTTVRFGSTISNIRGNSSINAINSLSFIGLPVKLILPAAIASGNVAFFAMPVTDRFGPDEDAAPPVARQQPGDRREEDSISRPAVGASNLPPQHRKLVAQDKDLNLVRGLRAATQHDHR